MYRRTVGLMLLLAAAALPAVPLSTAFTYQGDLHDNGLPADGVFDLRITPYAEAAVGATLAPALVIQDVLVTEGVFTTQIDFGAGFFVGDAVWLEIAVRDGDSADPNAFEILAPRQEVTPAPYALKTAPASVTDLELAADAVGSAQVQANAIGSGQIADGTVSTGEVANGSLLPEDFAFDAFNNSLWRVGGNTGIGSGFLGTTDNTPLALRSSVGVTINGAAPNTNSELTIRGNSSTPETNADIVLWPRGGEAFFDLVAIGTTPLDSRFGIFSVGTNPFTGFIQRFSIAGTGAIAAGTTASAVHPGTFVFADTSGGSFASTGNNQFIARAAGGVGINTPPYSSDYELSLGGSASSGNDHVEIALKPRAPDLDRSWAMRVSKDASTQLSLDYSSPTQGIVANPRFVLTGAGSLGIGAAQAVGHGGSFVFADGSSASTVSTTAANQFLVRAAGGIGINRPGGGSDEVSIGPRSGDAGQSADLVLGAAATVGQFRISTTVAGASDTIGRLSIRNTNATFPNAVIAEFITEGAVRRLGLFRGTTTGVSFSPTHPLHIGEATITNSGNGAHLTTGGVWTNGSSRAFKRAFTAIDVSDVLARVLALDVSRWRYRGDDDAWHIGPIAEDFHAAFGLGGDAQYIGTVDADGVALAAIQGLHAATQQRSAELESENASLRDALQRLEARVAALEAGGH
jgi:hypothetical protein